MSNLLKSKFLLGVMVATFMLGAFAFTQTASADCTITTTLRVGSRGVEVQCLQTVVGATADGKFGPMTKTSVMAWQSGHGLVADGVFGPKSRAVFAAGGFSASFAPAGCTSASGYSPTTGGACYAVSSPNANTFAPAGCTSASGYSPSTGGACYAVSSGGSFPAGCSSASGFSPTTGASCATGAVNNQSGPISVSLSANNPAAGYIIANQATADLLHFTLSGAGTVNSVTLQRTGISDQNTLSNVYLYDGNVRLTDGYSFNNVGQLTMNGLAIAVNGSKTISVKADVANVVNASSLGVTLVGFTAAGQSAVVTSVMGNQMSYGVGSLATAFLGTNTVTGTPTVNAGTSAYTVWSAPVQVNTRAVWLRGANFRMTGSAPADALGNIKLYVDGVQAGSAATMGTITGSNYAMFDLSASPVSLSTGSHTLDLRADVVKGASYTVQVSLQQASDLVLFDSQVGVNIAALGLAGVAFTSNNAATITIAAGSASVTVDPTFSATTNVTGGAQNVAIGRFKVHGYGEDVKVSTLLVTPVLTGCTPACAGLNNLTVYFNGAQVGSSQAWTSGTATFNLGSQMIIPAGTDSYIEVRADLQTNAGVNYTAGNVSANLAFATNNAQGQNSRASLNFPTGTVSGTVLAVQAGTLGVAVNTAYASQVASPNTAGAKIGSFILQNQSTSESVRVTSLIVALSGTTALTNLSNLRTSETSGSGSNPVQPQASNTFSVNFTVAPGATKIIDVLADTGGSLVAVNVNLTQTNVTATPTPGTTGSAGTAASNTVTITDTDGSTAVAPSAIAAVINGVTTTFNANAAALVVATPAEIAAAATGLVNAINANTNINGTVIATSSAGVITITSKTVGTGGNSITLTATGTTAGGFTATSGGTLAGGANSTSTAQVSTVTPAGTIEIGDTFTAGIGATNVTFTATVATVANVTAGLTAAWNANATLFAVATATDGSTLVNLTSKTLGANTFTPTSSAANGSVAGSGTVITSLTVTSIGATSNVSLAQNGNGTPVVGQTITLGAGTVTNPPTLVASSSSVAQYVASANGATNGSRATFNFKSTGGPAVVTELTFALSGTAGSVASVTVNGITAPVFGTTASITGLSIAVPNGGAGVNQDVFVTYAPIGLVGSSLPSGSTSILTLTTVKYQSGGTTTTLGVPTPLNVFAPTMTLVGSKPTLTVVDATTQLITGLVKVGSVTVTADAKGDIAINTLALAFASTGGVTSDLTTAGNVIVKNAADQSTITTTMSASTNLTAGGTNGRVTLTFGSGYPVTALTPVTLDIYATVAGLGGAGSDVLSMSLDTNKALFTWTDVAGNNATPLTGTLILNYPTNSSVINN